MRQPLFAAAAIVAAVAIAPAACANPAKDAAALDTAIAASHRSDASKARDQYRHPKETLTFFGVKPNHKVVELWPGAGWYTQILAPYLAKKGKLTAAVPPGARGEGTKKFLAADPAVYGKVALAGFPPSKDNAVVAKGSADVVLTFRNVHNWRFGGKDTAQDAFNQIFAMLKPGGVLGVVDHRLPEEMDSALEEKSGYMKRSSVIAFAEKAGFKLAGESDINANAKDTHAWPDGVWTLPPVYRLADKDKAIYAAIGESDRMTLKFVKPK